GVGNYNPIAAGAGDAGLERGAITAVAAMPQQPSSRRDRHAGCFIGGTVVNNNDLWRNLMLLQDLAQLGYHGRNARLFIEGRNDDANCLHRDTLKHRAPTTNPG